MVQINFGEERRNKRKTIQIEIYRVNSSTACESLSPSEHAKIKSVVLKWVRTSPKTTWTEQLGYATLLSQYRRFVLFTNRLLCHGIVTELGTQGAIRARKASPHTRLKRP